MAQLLSVNIGFPRDIQWNGRTVHTGIWKNPVRGRCRVNRLNLDGDGQGDLAGHGGEQRAVFVYQIESYRYWQQQLKRTEFVHGQFGENFTVEGLSDDTVCIGDRFQIGSALFEVTQPRVTCYRVGIRMNEPRMPLLLSVDYLHTRTVSKSLPMGTFLSAARNRFAMSSSICERSLGFDSAYTQALSSRFCVMPVKYQRTVQHNQKVFDGADLVRILSEVR